MEPADRSMYNIDIVRILSCSLLPRGRRSVARHTHGAYQFHHVIAGSGSFEIRGRRLPIRRGDFFYTRPLTPHRTVIPAESDYLLQYVAYLEFDSAQDADVTDDLETLLGEGRIRRLGNAGHALFAQVSRQCGTGDPRQRRAAAFMLVGLLYDLMLDMPTTSPGHPAVERALEFIRSHAGEAFSMDDLMAGLGLELSKSYFIRLFKKSVGVSPMKYAMNLKMRAASDLLRTTDEPLASVAARVGFADEYHFAKRFKQWSGVPPGAHRRGR